MYGKLILVCVIYSCLLDYSNKFKVNNKCICCEMAHHCRTIICKLVNNIGVHLDTFIYALCINLKTTYKLLLIKMLSHQQSNQRYTLNQKNRNTQTRYVSLIYFYNKCAKNRNSPSCIPHTHINIFPTDYILDCICIYCIDSLHSLKVDTLSAHYPCVMCVGPRYINSVTYLIKKRDFTKLQFYFNIQKIFKWPTRPP